MSDFNLTGQSTENLVILLENQHQIFKRYTKGRRKTTELLQWCNARWSKIGGSHGRLAQGWRRGRR